MIKTNTQALTDASGWLTGILGTATAGTKVAKNYGFLEWVNDNAVVIGVFCTVATALFYALAKILEMTLNVLRHRRADLKKRSRPSSSSSS